MKQDSITIRLNEGHPESGQRWVITQPIREFSPAGIKEALALVTESFLAFLPADLKR